MTDTKKILVVEDEKAILEPLTIKLEKEGFAVTQAKDGKVGLDRALEEKPDTIILDIVMPVMDGFAMLKELRRDSWGKNVPVIVLSNLSHPKQSEQAVGDNALIYLVKTECRLEDIIELVKSICSMSDFTGETSLHVKDIMIKAKQKVGVE